MLCGTYRTTAGFNVRPELVRVSSRRHHAPFRLPFNYLCGVPREITLFPDSQFVSSPFPAAGFSLRCSLSNDLFELFPPHPQQSGPALFQLIELRVVQQTISHTFFGTAHCKPIEEFSGQPI